MSRNHADIVVVGLGRFGEAVALALTKAGYHVLALDVDDEKVQRLSGDVFQALVADASDPEVVNDLELASFSFAVVAVGSAIEANILTTANLVDAEVTTVWARASTPQHASILTRLGASHVVMPQADMGERVAQMITGRVLDYVTFDDDFVLAEVSAPAWTHGRTLKDLAIRARHGVTVVAIRQPGGRFQNTTADTVVQEGALLVLAGAPDDVRFVASL